MLASTQHGGAMAPCFSKKNSKNPTKKGGKAGQPAQANADSETRYTDIVWTKQTLQPYAMFPELYGERKYANPGVSHSLMFDFPCLMY
jgi:hypothetical protein